MDSEVNITNVHIFTVMITAQLCIPQYTLDHDHMHDVQYIILKCVTQLATYKYICTKLTLLQRTLESSN